MTGRAAGYCAGYQQPGFMNRLLGRFGSMRNMFAPRANTPYQTPAAGRGRGRGFGRAAGGFRGGRGRGRF